LTKGGVFCILSRFKLTVSQRTNLYQLAATYDQWIWCDFVGSLRIRIILTSCTGRKSVF